jgi:hypothetical protein
MTVPNLSSGPVSASFFGASVDTPGTRTLNMAGVWKVFGHAVDSYGLIPFTNIRRFLLHVEDALPSLALTVGFSPLVLSIPRPFSGYFIRTTSLFAPGEANSTGGGGSVSGVYYWG